MEKMNALPAAGQCWYCGLFLSVLEYGRQESCRECGRDTRACRGCIFYDKSFNNECREPQADRVLDKEKANFCDYFKPSKKSELLGQSSALRAKEAAEALFKKK